MSATVSTPLVPVLSQHLLGTAPNLVKLVAIHDEMKPADALVGIESTLEKFEPNPCLKDGIFPNNFEHLGSS